MATAQQIRKGYLDYVLTNDEKPKSVYIFVKKIKITEADFYQFFSSFESIEKAIWFELTFETITKIKAQEVWLQYTAREKMLSFFYSYLENLKNERSFVIYSLKHHRGKFSTPDVLTGVKPIFENFAQEIIEEGLDSGELAERRFLSKRYKDALWVQFAFILNFWINDDSEGFEKSDEAIEKGINVTFDLFQHSPIDNLLEYGKFLSRNGKFAEKMRF
ncbi:TetR family transcriptional regulator C-terminal domain-containing protein [uncultured Pedobacter sp.]|uniref:TetR family transcriptional regulator C-terminal domain-containing protein n=1 Tax=uncultured Pedobacter sp. TaxID=246139 RepID=UPI0025EFC911|nr:TetR family transcriptional regulator C-terminal domain-containing protein [uncultured Pedobacter sp.]